MELTGQGQSFQSANPLGQAPVVPTNQQSNGSSGSVSKLKKIFLFLLVLTIVLSLGVYLFYYGDFSGNKAGKQETLSLGYQKFLDLASKNKDFVSGASIQVIFSGRLTNIDEGKTWVLEKEGKSFTINHSGTSNIRHFRQTSEQGKPPVPVKTQDIQSGEEVMILALIDLNSAKVRVVSIEATLPAQPNNDVQVSTPSAQ